MRRFREARHKFPAGEDAQQAKEAFGARLRELRQEASLTGRALARLTEVFSARVSPRLARQKVLRSGRRRFVVVLAEQALRTRLGTPQVMAAQLEHVQEVMRLPNVSVGIIPAMAERYTVAQVPFWIWDDARVTLETVSARLEMTRPDEIALYATVFDQLRQSAVYGSRARDLISEAVADHLQHSATT